MLTIRSPDSHSLQLGPLPNPYNVPGTDIWLDIEMDLTHNFQPDRTRHFLAEVYRNITMHVIEQSDGPIQGFVDLTDGYFTMFVNPRLPARPTLEYSQLAIALKGLGMKMGTVAYCHCVVEIKTAENDHPIGHLWFGLAQP